MNEERLADARMRTLSVLSPAVVHDLRGAASALALHLQLLAVDPEDERGRERRRRSLATADQERRRLFALAEVFARHATVPNAAVGEFDLVAASADAVGLTRPFAGQRRVTLTMTPVAAPRPVHGRGEVVTQVLLDVLVHVLQESPRGAGIEVTVEGAERGARTVIRGASEDVYPGGEHLAGFASAVRWAGGDLRTEAGALTLEFPASGREETS